MADDREKISNGPNERPVNESIAGTGPGWPDDGLAPGEDLPEPPSDEEVARVAEKLGRLSRNPRSVRPELSRRAGEVLRLRSARTEDA